jgi:hypothetical protein
MRFLECLYGGGAEFSIENTKINIHTLITSIELKEELIANSVKDDLAKINSLLMRVMIHDVLRDNVNLFLLPYNIIFISPKTIPNMIISTRTILLIWTTLLASLPSSRVV